MSHFANNENKKDNKFFISKRVIIFLIVFTVLCVVGTIGAILYKNSKNKENVFQNQDELASSRQNEEMIIPDGLGIKSFKEKFKQNDLKIIEEERFKGEEVENEWGKYYPITIEYVQIDGLKDKDVQDKINQEIDNSINSMLDENELTNSNVQEINIHARCTANYGNVLSVQIFKNVMLKEYPDDYNWNNRAFVGLNYNLSTGEKLSFNDLFTNTASIKTIISQALYNSLAWNYSRGVGEDMSQGDYSNLQDDVFKTVYAFNSNKKFEYYFTQNHIYMYINDKNIEISMIDIYKDIAIYNRYKDDTGIYDGKHLKNDKFYVLMDERFGIYLRTEEIMDGLFIDMYIGGNVDENKNNIINVLKLEMERIIEENKQYVVNNSNKARVVTVCAQCHHNSETDKDIDVYYVKEIFTMDKAYYDRNMFTNIIKCAQDPFGGGGIGFNYYFYDENNTQDKSVEKTYFYENRIYDLLGQTYWIEDDMYNNSTGMYEIKKKIVYDALTNEVISEENNSYNIN